MVQCAEEPPFPMPMNWQNSCHDNCIMETFLGRLKNEMFHGLEKDTHLLKSFPKQLLTILDITAEEYSQKQNGCLPLNSEKHP